MSKEVQYNLYETSNEIFPRNLKNPKIVWNHKRSLIFNKTIKLEVSYILISNYITKFKQSKKDDIIKTNIQINKTEQREQKINSCIQNQLLAGRQKNPTILGNDCHSISDAGKTKYPHEKNAIELLSYIIHKNQLNVG